ncbi:MAG: hypothetical protein O3A46_15535 [Candidatus Poribacteria bacterium]|nr:hypothetical protein [Candidatus Poribacteria bacterium]
MPMIGFLIPFILFAFMAIIFGSHAAGKRRQGAFGGDQQLLEQLDEILEEVRRLREQQADLTLMVDDLAAERGRLADSSRQNQQ